MTKCLSPTEIATLGCSFMEAKVLLAAVKLCLFDALEDGSPTGSEIGERLGLHPRAILDFSDTPGYAACARAGLHGRRRPGWRADAGFRHVAVPPVGGPASAAIACK